jgi:hypothetical protein
LRAAPGRISGTGPAHPGTPGSETSLPFLNAFGLGIEGRAAGGAGRTGVRTHARFVCRGVTEGSTKALRMTLCKAQTIIADADCSDSVAGH